MQPGKAKELENDCHNILKTITTGAPTFSCRTLLSQPGIHNDMKYHAHSPTIIPWALAVSEEGELVAALLEYFVPSILECTLQESV